MGVAAVGTTHPRLPAPPPQRGWPPRMAQLPLCLTSPLTAGQAVHPLKG